jgi:hypothetical protein
MIDQPVVFYFDDLDRSLDGDFDYDFKNSREVAGSKW